MEKAYDRCVYPTDEAMQAAGSSIQYGEQRDAMLYTSEISRTVSAGAGLYPE